MNHPCGCSHDTLDDTRGRRIAKGVRCALRGEANRRVIHPGDAFLLRTPAEGDAYEFTVAVHITWCVEGDETVKRLRARLPRFHRDLEERLLRRLRPVVRAYPPYEPQKAEEKAGPEVDTELSNVEYRFDHGCARPRAGRVLVSPAKEVRDLQRVAWKRRQEMTNGHDLAELLKTQLGERREWWTAFLGDGLDQWLTPYAVELAEDPNAAPEVVRRLRDDEKERITELAETFKKQTHGYRQSDDFDTMISNETVLRHLIKTIGLPVPPPGHPFGEPPDIRAVNGNGSATGDATGSRE